MVEQIVKYWCPPDKEHFNDTIFDEEYYLTKYDPIFTTDTHNILENGKYKIGKTQDTWKEGERYVLILGKVKRSYLVKYLYHLDSDINYASTQVVIKISMRKVDIVNIKNNKLFTKNLVNDVRSNNQNLEFDISEAKSDIELFLNNIDYDFIFDNIGKTVTDLYIENNLGLSFELYYRDLLYSTSELIDYVEEFQIIIHEIEKIIGDNFVIEQDFIIKNIYNYLEFQISCKGVPNMYKYN